MNNSANELPVEVIEVCEDVKNVNSRKCRQNNRGFCKQIIRCRYLHPEDGKKLETKMCVEKLCPD